jgi:formate dehydrogenase maturation protein FdhE
VEYGRRKGVHCLTIFRICSVELWTLKRQLLALVFFVYSLIYSNIIIYHAGLHRNISMVYDMIDNKMNSSNSSTTNFLDLDSLEILSQKLTRNLLKEKYTGKSAPIQASLERVERAILQSPVKKT